MLAKSWKMKTARHIEAATLLKYNSYSAFGSSSGSGLLGLKEVGELSRA